MKSNVRYKEIKPPTTIKSGSRRTASSEENVVCYWAKPLQDSVRELGSEFIVSLLADIVLVTPPSEKLSMYDASDPNADSTKTIKTGTKRTTGPK
jgi:hypothetical protein